MTLNPNKVGITIYCASCGRPKVPIGRSVSIYMSNSICARDSCYGYSEEPYAGSLWPGESEADFGYPVSDHGTAIVQAAKEETTT